MKTRVSRRRFAEAGFTFLELLVAGAVFSILSLGLFMFLRSTSATASRQDLHTRRWMTWGRVNEALRDDLAQAQTVRVISDKHMQMRLFFLGPNLEHLYSDVEWIQEDDTSITRREGRQKHVFSFAADLRPEERVLWRLRGVP